jgi:hypothetical protein
MQIDVKLNDFKKHLLYELHARGEMRRGAQPKFDLILKLLRGGKNHIINIIICCN